MAVQQEQTIDINAVGQEVSAKINELLPQNVRAYGNNEVIGEKNGFEIRVGRDFEEIGFGESEPYDYMVISNGNTPIATITDEGIVTPLSENRREVADAVKAAREYTMANASKPSAASLISTNEAPTTLPAMADFLKLEVENVVVFSKINFPATGITKLGEVDGFAVYASQDEIELGMGESEMSNVLTIEKDGVIIAAVTDERNWEMYVSDAGVVDSAIEAAFKVIAT